MIRKTMTKQIRREGRHNQLKKTTEKENDCQYNFLTRMDV